MNCIIVLNDFELSLKIILQKSFDPSIDFYDVASNYVMAIILVYDS